MDIVRRVWSFGSYKNMEGEAARFEKLKGWFNSCSVRIHLVPFLQKYRTLCGLELMLLSFSENVEPSAFQPRDENPSMLHL